LKKDAFEKRALGGRRRKCALGGGRRKHPLRSAFERAPSEARLVKMRPAFKCHKHERWTPKACLGRGTPKRMRGSRVVVLPICSDPGGVAARRPLGGVPLKGCLWSASPRLQVPLLSQGVAHPTLQMQLFWRGAFYLKVQVLLAFQGILHPRLQVPLLLQAILGCRCCCFSKEFCSLECEL